MELKRVQKGSRERVGSTARSRSDCLVHSQTFLNRDRLGRSKDSTYYLYEPTTRAANCLPWTEGTDNDGDGTTFAEELVAIIKSLIPNDRSKIHTIIDALNGKLTVNKAVGRFDKQTKRWGLLFGRLPVKGVSFGELNHNGMYWFKWV